MLFSAKFLAAMPCKIATTTVVSALQNVLRSSCGPTTHKLQSNYGRATDKNYSCYDNFYDHGYGVIGYATLTFLVPTVCVCVNSP